MYTYFFLFNFVSQFAVATRQYTDTHTPQDRNTIHIYMRMEGYTHTYSYSCPILLSPTTGEFVRTTIIT